MEATASPALERWEAGVTLEKTAVLWEDTSKILKDFDSCKAYGPGEISPHALKEKGETLERPLEMLKKSVEK